MNPNRLLVAPEPFESESLAGYILRLTKENGYESSTWIYGLIGVQNSTNLSEDMYQRLSNLVSIKMDKLKKLSLLNQNIEISLKYISLGKAKICPICLKEKGYVNRLWDMVFMCACPIHKILLIDTCQKCKRQIHLVRNNIDTCACEFNFKESDIQFLRDEELILSKFIWEKYYNNYASKIFEYPLINLNIKDVFDLIFLIFRINNLNVSKRPVSIKRLSVLEMHGEILNILHIFENWPYNFFGLLNDIKSQVHNVRSNKGIYGRYGELYRILKEEFKKMPFMVKAFEEYLWENRNEYLSSKSVIHKISTNTGVRNLYMHGTEAIKYLGLKLPTIQFLIKKKVLKGSLSRFGKVVFTVVEKESADLFLEKVNNWYSFGVTMKLLGISEKVLKELAEKKILEVFEFPMNYGQIKKRFFNPSSINSLFFELDSRLTGEYSNNSINFTDGFTFARNMILRKDFTFVTFLNDILGNKILPSIKNSDSGFTGYYFEKDKIKEYTVSQIDMYNKDSISRDEALRELNLTNTNFADLIKVGLLNVKKRNDTNQGSRVPKGEIKKFKCTYIDLKTIRKVYHFNFNPTVEQFMKNGIKPVTGRKIDGCKKYYFLRIEIEKITKSNLNI